MRLRTLLERGITRGFHRCNGVAKEQPVKPVIEQLSELVAAAFEAAGVPGSYGIVELSRRPEQAQFQCNGAMAASKVVRRAPRAIADDVVKNLVGAPILGEVSVAGPGFINLNVVDDHLAALAEAQRVHPRLDVPDAAAKTIVLDFGGPNVAKAMHVGHLRSSVIGDCLQRLFRFQGHRVVSDIHLGDWGLQMGMLVREVERRHPELPYFDPSFDGDYPAEPPVDMDDLQVMYPAASERCKADEAERLAARLATADLQDGRRGYRALWQHFVDVSVSALRTNYDALGVSFDLWNGESTVQRSVGPLTERLEASGLLEESDGAKIIRVSDDADAPPLIFLKRDGGATYGTTDMATILERVEEFDPDEIVYVVDKRQSLHFEQVFEASRKAGISGRATLEHIGFGTVNGTDGKPFKTRDGGVMRLEDLISMAEEEALARLAEADFRSSLTAEERGPVARLVGIATVKFADLQNQRTSDYVFDLQKFSRFEGKTGPYVQYAAVRVKSVLANGAEQGHEPGVILAPVAPQERDLMLALLELPRAIEGASERRTPHLLCAHAYGLARQFSKFYEAVRILDADAPKAVVASRLGLAELTLRQLALVFHLLGIEIPERM